MPFTFLWTAGEDAILKRMAAEGRYAYEIAPFVGRSPKAVSQRARHLGIEVNALSENGMSGRWTDEQDAKLVRLVSQGLSAREIAERFPGRTRNAIIGRCNRLGVTLHASPGPIKRKAKPKPEPKPKAKPSPKPVPIRQELPEPIEVGGLDGIVGDLIAAGPRECRGITAADRLCLKHTAPGRVYCTECHDRYYLKPKRRSGGFGALKDIHSPMVRGR